MTTNQFGPIPTKEDIEELTSDMARLLHDKGAMLQGAVLADLVAMYFAGHHPGIREGAVDAWLKAMRGLVEVNEKMILQRQGVTSWDELRATPSGKPN